MMSHSDQRALIGLLAMFDGKMYYSNKLEHTPSMNNPYTEGAVLAAPDNPETFIELKIGLDQSDMPFACSCRKISPSWLLRDLGGMGAYSTFQEVSLQHPSAKRILRIYRLWKRLAETRVAGGKHLVDRTLSASPNDDDNDDDDIDPEEGTPIIEYL